MYSPYDGVVKELVVAEEETAYLEKPIVVFEVEDDINASRSIICAVYEHCTMYVCSRSSKG